MNAAKQRSRSLWMETPLLTRGPVEGDLKTDVLIVGAGIAGLSIAYELILRGYRVVIVDRGDSAGGMSARTSAHLASECDDYYHKLMDTRGANHARQYYDSQSAAIARIQEIVRAEAIEADFARVPAYLFAPDDKGAKLLEREIDAVERVGFAGVPWSKAPVAGAVVSALRFPGQARFHPVKYLNGLAEAIERRGGTLHGDTAIEEIEETDNGIGARGAAGQRITAAFAVAATNTPFVERVSTHAKQAPYRTYVIAAEVPRDSVEDALIWDTEEPYHYVRIQPGEQNDVLLVGGEDHKSGTESDQDERLERLQAWMRTRFPQAETITHQWSGQVYEPADLMPFIGRAAGKQRTFIVSGDSGEGLTTGVVASLIIPDLIEGRASPWASAYAPDRLPLSPSAAANFAQETAGTVGHWVEHVTSGEVEIDHLAKGEGGIVRDGASKLAIYRDETGALHRFSASCTHLGCIVHWNGFEKCWDCPCHASQFSPLGEVQQGPATAPLSRA